MMMYATIICSILLLRKEQKVAPKKFDWKIITKAKLRTIFVSGGISLEDVEGNQKK
jgi:phosphoribosylanthranilate isomerase